MLNHLVNLSEVKQFIDNPKALFVVNNSGGKDSQAMSILVSKLGIPAERVLNMHAVLPEVDWTSTDKQASYIAARNGQQFFTVQAKKTFLQMVRERTMFPSDMCRYCTSALKKAPIDQFVKQYADSHGFTIVVNCMGMRAQESTKRAKGLDKKDFKVTGIVTTFMYDAKTARKGKGKAKTGKLDWYQWLPIHSMLTNEVFALIEQVGQKPHYCYSLGNERCSCVFCIFSSQNDLEIGAKHCPKLAHKYIELEKDIGHTMFCKTKTIKKVKYPVPVSLESKIAHILNAN